ncbi:DNA polymerase II [Sulfolobus sp. A20]|uniref:DNA polymerase domain-containing protein n=1 Tax=Saccharolobus sp. A20 TaxID=1891280 RepID=UPI00084624E0|nr:DNA polymerase domain-containing protein [Sulfolobus sp. A20]TRM76006.1 DNA polymerase II [Sulfolobus sp. B5]TRM78105.1 DNA polymerase II [Sulfolobus sp. A20-N-F8]TRM82488.1 DNA polymerase II [Sulfolobus sp. D5]TRM85561.1 DNA polymerase II [Sulfolobus sp. F3]TRM88207.1 DNA polymerase II [Sulfolobus sp. C3]TRM94623.1 DNA polymerase II [Sulfolobus sp. A20-N-G8]TRN01439.1 DNA polymerase II [Sulfolobus sp. F1]TRN04052.1 DNA polymerase II [Sulfolobus sp. E1]
MEGYVVDAVPSYNSVELVLDNFRRVKVKTTFPIYVMTDNPERITEHPSVISYEEEIWRDLSGKEVKLYRFELTDLNAYYYIRKRVKTVNELPTVMSQVLNRLNALPFRKVSISKRGIELIQDDLSFPDIIYASVITKDWYGKSFYGKKYVANVNGKTFEGKVDELDLTVDVAECYGIACKSVKASVLITSKRAPVSVKGLIEWSLLSKTLIRELKDATIGKALTTNETWVAFKRRIIIPNVVPRVEKVRTIEELKSVDKGGLILFPKIGCYNNVSQLDFSSMYPSLIVKYNISAETVDKCNDVLTEIGHSICLKEKGIVPEALEWLIKRKEELKRIDEERAEAVKWILVASFGYLGYRNSKFGKIEAYELVTYFARKTLRKAIELAKEYDLEVLHGIIDSLIVRGDKVEDYMKRVEEVTGLKMKRDDMNWVIFFQNRKGMSYPMRYLGKLKKGEMKVKGMIRENMPNVIKDFLRDAVEVLSKADTCEEIDVSKLIALRDEYRKRIALSRDPTDYVLWVKDNPLVRGVRGFYDARRGYMGRDVDYYLNYLDRVYHDLLGGIIGINDWIPNY